MPHLRCRAAIVFLFLLFAPLLFAADHGNGVVAFANSGAAAAQDDFLLGLAQLHNFQYPDAAVSFRRAQEKDSGFAMAYWGEAMTFNHAVWAEQDRDAARRALAKLGPTPAARAAKAPTAREKAYLHAVETLYGEGTKYQRDDRYALDMEQLHNDYPDDIDATCFFALALLGTSHAGRDVPTYQRAAQLMQKVFEQYPNHPGAAHYLIHSVDDAEHASMGLAAARAYAKIAPDSPHAMHMTSHIYLALGLWDDVVQANEATIRLANAKRKAVSPNAPLPGCGHATTWLAYGYAQLGRLRQSERLVLECGEEMRTRPVTATGAAVLDYDGTSAASFSVMRSRYLIDTGDWAGAVAAAEVDVKGNVVAEFTRDFVDAWRAAKDGSIKDAASAIERTRKTAKRLGAAAAKAGIPAGHPLRRVPLIEMDQLDGLLLLRKGDAVKGIALLQKAADAEKATPMEFGPPSLDKPASELLGEALLALDRPKEARTAFEAAQLLAPGRGQSLIGLSSGALRLNDLELARSVGARLSRVGLREALNALRPALEWRGRAVVHLPDRDVAIEGLWRYQPPGRAIVATFESAKGPDATRTLLLSAPLGWIVSEGVRTALPADALAEEVHQFYLYSLLRALPLNEPGVKLTGVPPDAKGKKGLKVEAAGRLPVTLYLDAFGRAVSLSTNFATPAGPGDAEDIGFSGVMEADGIPWFRHMQILRAGKPWFDLDVTSFRTTPALEEAQIVASP